MEPRTLLRLQGAYYAATGVWSLVSIGTFQKVTGPKTDKWLVKTVGALVTVMGMSMLRAAQRREVAPETALLATGSAAAFGLVDTNYALKGRISKVYLLDAIAQAALLRGWAKARAA